MTTHRTITLTNRPPVRINEGTWPVIATAGWYEGEIKCQANRSGWIRVRRHEDGRTIVYGGYDTVWRGEACIRAGELLTIDCDVVAAIRRVGIDVAAEESCIRACIGDLPAEEI